MRRLSLALGLAVLLGISLVAARARHDGGGSPYVTMPVERGPIAALVTATGSVNRVETVQVGTYVSGPIQVISVDFNSPVQRGQLLAKIDPRPFQVKVDGAAADLANARARLDKDRADLTLKEVTLKRTRALRSEGIVSESDLDLATSQERQARAQIELDQAEIRTADAKLREAEVNLAYTDITSPVDGVVVARNVDVGQTVAATFQTPTLFLVAEDLTKMQVSASVSESDIGPVAAGQEVSFSVDAYPATTFAGRVEQVRNAPLTVQNVVTYDVVSVDNRDLLLKPGMTANVTIATATRPDALRVSTSALRFRPPADDDGEVVVEALRGITLPVRAGELVAIVGASGSGKSTLLNILGCLDRPSSGVYRLDGRDVSRLTADQRAVLRNACIGFVFQSFNLLPRTSARENVELPLVYGDAPPAEHRQRARDALGAVGLADAADRLPSQLSGGQQQRVAIARALVSRPRLILADEPTGNLDTATSRDIMDLLRALNRTHGLTLVVVTHEPDIAALTDRVVMMRDGRVVADGQPGHVLGRAEEPAV